MSRSASASVRAGEPASPATGHQLLGGFAILLKGLRQWMQANLPAGAGMTVPRANLLIGLTLKSEPAGMSELGESLGMSPRNMTVLVDGLEKDGLVRRASHEHDRRIKLVELTATGKRVAEQELRPSWLAAAALFDDFTPAERAELSALLAKVADALRSRGIDVPLPDQVRPA